MTIICAFLLLLFFFLFLHSNIHLEYVSLQIKIDFNG